MNNISHLKTEDENFFGSQSYAIATVPQLYQNSFNSSRRASISSILSGHSSHSSSFESFTRPHTPTNSSPTCATIAPRMLHSLSSSLEMYEDSESSITYDNPFFGFYNQDNSQEISQEFDLKFDASCYTTAIIDSAAIPVAASLVLPSHPLPSSPYSLYDMGLVKQSMLQMQSSTTRSRRHSGVSRTLDHGNLPLVVTSADKHHKCQHKEPNGLQCDKKFKRQEHLRRHERTHTGAKPHPCPFVGHPIYKCNKSFSRRDNLKAHWKTHEKQHGRNVFVRGIPENPEDWNEEYDRLHGVHYVHGISFMH